MLYKLKTYWEMSADILIEAGSIDEAMEIADEEPLPENGEYVSCSFQVDENYEVVTPGTFRDALIVKVHEIEDLSDACSEETIEVLPLKEEKIIKSKKEFESFIKEYEGYAYNGYINGTHVIGGIVDPGDIEFADEFLWEETNESIISNKD